jgi:hypothetical protein
LSDCPNIQLLDKFIKIPGHQERLKCLLIKIKQPAMNKFMVNRTGASQASLVNINFFINNLWQFNLTYLTGIGNIQGMIVINNINGTKKFCG